MADFETDVELSISVPSRELRDIRRTIETEFEDIAVGVDAGIGADPSDSVGAVEAERERLRRQSVRLARSRTQDISRIVEILEDVEEDVSEIEDSGDGGLLERLPRLGITGALGVGAFGLGALGSTVSSLSSSLDGIPERIGVEDPSPLGVEVPDPLPVEDIDPLPVSDIDPIEFILSRPTEEGTPSGGGTPSGVPDSSISRTREGALNDIEPSPDTVGSDVPDSSISRIRDDGLADSGVDVAEAAEKGAAGGIIGAIGARLAEIRGAVGGGLRGPTPGGVPLPAPTIPIAEELGERTDILPAPQRGRGSSLQTLTPAQTATQPEITVNVGDIQTDVQADVQNAVDEAIQQVEQDRDRQIQELRNTIERQVRNLERGIRRGTSTGIR